MSQPTIYHNPRCSKSRYTLQLLRGCGLDPQIVLYLEDPPNAERISSLCAAMGKRPLEIMRTKEARFKELGLSKDDDRSDAQWFKLMAANPVLLERPIVVMDNEVALGRPPESVLDIL